LESPGFWFEEVPEEQRYWFLVHAGASFREEAELDDAIPGDLRAELQDVDAAVRHEEAFGAPAREARERVRRAREARERKDAAGYGPETLSIPWWPEVVKYFHEEGVERVDAPMIFTAKEAAEEARRGQEASEPGAYLALAEVEGEEEADEAFDNTPSLRTMWMDGDALLDKLGDSDFLCVMVDGRLKLRRDFAEELRGSLQDRD